MSSMTFGQKKFTPTAPEKGSFPLDHDGVCKKAMLHYMICLRESKNSNTKCRELAKEYLACRMDSEYQLPKWLIQQ
ncbi:hypothetical protein GE061_010337 [Apolygus lucorum]|uniref:CHCH domain-containing protein n=1 Tax=Apolygus lucorum TaxID=248454 RepID=A0A8S9Y4S7_APOLU|nr:hypothetical protein GE061_010337 [Apolygus lucorum]